MFSKMMPLLALAACATMLAACSGVRPALNATPPASVASRSELAKELSSLNVAIEATSEEIAKTLNKAVRQELYRGSTKTRGLSADILRNGPIAVSAADNFLYFTVPVTLSLNYGIFSTPALPLKLRFRAGAQVSQDWTLATEVQYLGISELLAEEVGIGPLSLKPRSIVDGVMQPLQKVLSDVVNRNVNEALPLRAQVEKAWQAAQQPILVDKEFQVWLKLTPREVTLFPLQAQQNRVSMSVGVTSYIELVVGPAPAAAPARPLPALKLVKNLDRRFRLAVNTEIYYRDLVSAAAPLLLNKEFAADGRSIVLKQFEIYGNGDRFVIKLETQGTLDGTFYLTGKPHFDPQTNRFSVEEVEFDLQTQSLLLKSADWLLHSTIRDRIQEKLNLDLTKRMEQSREMAGKAIAQRKLADHVLLKGNITSFRFSDLLVKPDKVSLQLYAEGDSALVLQ
jgi:hypothetical protein